MSKLIKVIFEYSDGLKKHIENTELEKWLSFNAIVAQSAFTHNVNPPWESIKWTVTDTKKQFIY